ncbi:MAG: hypothetical protein NC548_05830 [Lachnospiraceae bacterium]|nr:hypothetical protein [Lachnospiraceae bacterium]
MPPLEASKKELVLGVNVLNKPGERSGPTAWAQLILQLIFLRPGTYPSQPAMGVGIQDYDYEFVDVAVEKLNSIIPAQIAMYLADIPVDGVVVSTFEYQGKQIMMIQINLIDNGAIVTEVIATEVKNRIIDFDISWPT